MSIRWIIYNTRYSHLSTTLFRLITISSKTNCFQMSQMNCIKPSLLTGRVGWTMNSQWLIMKIKVRRISNLRSVKCVSQRPIQNHLSERMHCNNTKMTKDNPLIFFHWLGINHLVTPLKDVQMDSAWLSCCVNIASSCQEDSIPHLLHSCIEY